MEKIENHLKEDEHERKSSQKSFFPFFSKWAVWGVLIILFSCVLSLVWQPIEVTAGTPHSQWMIFFNFLSQLVPNALQTIGIAVVLGACFDFSKNSQNFIDFVSLLLSDIVVSKTFLSRLEDSGKREAMGLILRPTENQIAQYSRIDDYFEKRILDSMGMWDTNFKTNTVINVRIIMNQEKGIVETVGTMTYRIYKVKDKYLDILTTFERKGSKISDTTIYFPGGSFPVKTPESFEENTAGTQYTTFKFQVPESLYKYPYLTIERKVYEPGFDHWTNFHWTSLTPYDGLVFNLTCEDTLTIKDHIIFDDKKLYNVKINDERTQMHIVSTDWLEANTGFTVTISTSS